MILLLDNALATIVAGILAFLLISLQARGQQASVERAMMFGAKKHTLSLANVLERDLTNAGYDRAPGEPRLYDYDKATQDGVTYTRRFVFRTLDAASGSPLEVKYETRKVGTAEIDGATAPLFQWRRYECGSSFNACVNNDTGWDEAGSSQPALLDFDIVMKTGGSSGTSNLDAAERLDVALAHAVAPNTAGSQYLRGFRRLDWRVTLTPPNLRGFQ